MWPLGPMSHPSPPYDIDQVGNPGPVRGGGIKRPVPSEESYPCKTQAWYSVTSALLAYRLTRSGGAAHGRSLDDKATRTDGLMRPGRHQHRRRSPPTPWTGARGKRYSTPGSLLPGSLLPGSLFGFAAFTTAWSQAWLQGTFKKVGHRRASGTAPNGLWQAKETVYQPFCFLRPSPVGSGVGGAVGMLDSEEAEVAISRRHDIGCIPGSSGIELAGSRLQRMHHLRVLARRKPRLGAGGDRVVWQDPTKPSPSANQPATAVA